MSRIIIAVLFFLCATYTFAQSDNSIPDNLQTSDIDENSAVLSWNNNDNAYKYIVSYNIPLSDQKTVLETKDTFLTLTDLIPFTQYLWRVRMLNYNFDTTDWSDYNSFVTLGSGGECIEVEDFTVSYINNGSITLQWYTNGDINYWEIVCDDVDVSPEKSTVRSFTKNNSVQFTNLEDSKIYRVSIRSHCDGGIGQWHSILARCIDENQYVDLPLCLSFDNTDSNEYIGYISDKSNPWIIGNGVTKNTSDNTDYSMYISNSNGENNTFDNTVNSISYAYLTLLVPEESLGFKINFDYMSSLTCDNAGLKIFLISAGSNINTQVLPSSIYQIGEYIYQGTDGEWQNIQIEVPNEYAGLKYKLMFAWYNDSTCENNNSPAIDNICITPRYCAIPDSLEAKNIQTNSADLYWSVKNNETQYVLEYKKSTDSLWSVKENVNNGYYLTELEDNTVYLWRLKALCDGEESLLSQVDSFTTQIIILPIDIESISYSVGYDTAFFQWEDNMDAASYILSYRKNDYNEPWTDTTVYFNYCSLTGLTSNTEYAIKIKKVNAENVSSKYSQEIVFSTLCKPINQYPYVVTDIINYNTQSGFVNAPVCYEYDMSTLTSVTFDFTPLDAPLLSFDLQANCLASLYISDNGGMSFKLFEQYEYDSQKQDYTNHSILLKDYIGENNVKLRFVFSDNDLSSIIGKIKNISIQNACAAPSVISFDSIGKQSVSISWNSSESISLWTVQLFKEDNNYITKYYTSEPSITISDLDSATTYKLIISSSCDAETSFDSSEVYFTTDGMSVSECPIPKNFIAYWYPKKSDETILAVWDADKDNYAWEVYYKELYAVNWQTKMVTVTPQFSIRNLEENETWLIKVRTICAPGDTSEFTSIDTVTVGTSALIHVEQSAEVITLYPNPTEGIINISAQDKEISNAIIVSPLGKVIKKWSKLPSQIDISNMHAGNYVLIGYINGKQFKINFIKL